MIMEGNGCNRQSKGEDGTMLTNESVTAWITDRMSRYEYNNLKELEGFAFDAPLVGFSRGDDPLYAFYKEHIDPHFYRLPQEWLEAVLGGSYDPSGISVISWVLPQTVDTKEKSRKCVDCPPLEWQMSRVHGEECNRALAEALVAHLTAQGIPSVAPMLSEQFSWGESEVHGKISNWSERHTAYISGLGTFGLCDGLISEKGKAARYGSVIVYAPLTATVRKYSTYNEYCMAKNGCTACIRRCPAGAITKDGHDKAKCVAYHRDAIKSICHERYGYDGYSVCGLCQTGVPCESGIPTWEPREQTAE